MKVILIPIYYLSWHYSRAFKHVLDIYKNVMFFSLNFFSIKTLFSTIFRPFKSPIEVKKSKNKDDANSEIAIVTFLMVCLGLFVRTATIITGILFAILVFFFWAIVFVFWAVLPIVLMFLLFAGLISYLKYGHIF